MYQLYQSLIEKIKADQVTKYIRKHGGPVRGKRPIATVQPDQPRKVEQAPQNGRRRAREFARQAVHSIPSASGQDRQILPPNKQSTSIQDQPIPSATAHETSAERALNSKANARELPSEFAQEDEERITCTEGCGRSFNANGLEKHVKVCKKVFQTKRKEFSVKQDPEAEQAKKKHQSPKQKKQTGDAEGARKWQRQSNLFRLSMKRGNKTLTAQEEKLLKQLEEEADERIQCQLCRCKFEQKAYERHRPFCENRQKKKKK